MKQYLKAFSVYEREGKTYWDRVGSAFPTKNGGLTVLLNAVPAAKDGQVKIVLQVPLPPVDQAPAPASAPRRNYRRA